MQSAAAKMAQSAIRGGKLGAAPLLGGEAIAKRGV